MGLPHELVVDRLVEYGPLPAVLEKHKFGKRSAVQEAARMVRRIGILVEQVSQAARKPPGDVSRCDRMPPVRYPLGDTKPGQLHAREGKIEQFHAPARQAQAPYEAQIAPPRKRGLEREVLACCDVVFDLLQDQSAGSEQLPLGCPGVRGLRRSDRR